MPPGQFVSALAHVALRRVEDRQRYLETEVMVARVELATSALANMQRRHASIDT